MIIYRAISLFHPKKSEFQFFYYIKKMGHMGTLTLAWRFNRLQREYCDPFESIQYEQDCMDLFNPEYNISPTAGSSFPK
jgi:hypothetical protein